MKFLQKWNIVLRIKESLLSPSYKVFVNGLVHITKKMVNILFHNVKDVIIILQSDDHSEIAVNKNY